MSKKSQVKWSSLKEKGGYLPLMLILFIYKSLGRLFIKPILYIIVFWYWIFSSSIKKNSLIYLRRNYIYSSKSSFKNIPNIIDTYFHFIQFASAILDKIDAWLGYKNKNQIIIHGEDIVKEYYQKGLILFVSHFGNIEVLKAINASRPQKINILVYQKHSSGFNKFLKKISKNSQASLIAVDEIDLNTSIMLEEKVSRGEWIVIAVDRVPINSNRILTIPFLGYPASWPQGGWLIANLLKVPVIASFCYQENEQTKIYFHSLSEKVNFSRKHRNDQMQELAVKYVKLLEGHCLKAPYQWFNFYHFWD